MYYYKYTDKYINIVEYWSNLRCRRHIIINVWIMMKSVQEINLKHRNVAQILKFCNSYTSRSLLQCQIQCITIGIRAICDVRSARIAYLLRRQLGRIGRTFVIRAVHSELHCRIDGPRSGDSESSRFLSVLSTLPSCTAKGIRDR